MFELVWEYMILTAAGWEKVDKTVYEKYNGQKEKLPKYILGVH